MILKQKQKRLFSGLLLSKIEMKMMSSTLNLKVLSKIFRQVKLTRSQTVPLRSRPSVKRCLTVLLSFPLRQKDCLVVCLLVKGERENYSPQTYHDQIHLPIFVCLFFFEGFCQGLVYVYLASDVEVSVNWWVDTNLKLIILCLISPHVSFKSLQS